MKMIIDSEDFSGSIYFNEIDKGKSNVEIWGDYCAMTLCAAKTFVQKTFELDNLDQEKDLVLLILETITALAEAYYNDASHRE